MCTKKILIVDDNELIVEVMSYILISSGYEVSSLNTGEGVIAAVSKTHPDLVILDDTLPYMRGTDICSILKLNQATHDTPVIICSGNEDAERALTQNGAADDFLLKPFDMHSLLDKVEHQLAA
jgi:DNA-binding response OmpR family regulator